MKKFTVIALICLSVAVLSLAALIIFKPAGKPSAKEPDISALSGHGKNTFAENGLPLPKGKTLLTDTSFAQCMADADGDGNDDRITCATLGDEYETEYICVQYANGKTPDSEYTCRNGYAHPELSLGNYNGIAVIYIKGESQGSNGEQMVHPFVLGEGGKIVPAVNVKAEYMEETSVFKLPCFSNLKIGETYDTGRIVAETEFAPTLYISVSESILNDSAYDEEYGLRILSANCEMNVNAENNTVTCIFDCAVIEADDSYSDDVTPVELVVTLAFDGREFTVSEWKYNIADGTEYSFEGDVPAPSSVPDTTTSPQGTGNSAKSYLPTVHLDSRENATVTASVDIDGDGSKERIDIATDKSYESTLTIYSKGSTVYTQKGDFIEIFCVDITGDGRYAVLVQEAEDSSDTVNAYFMNGNRFNQIKVDSALSCENEIWGYVANTGEGEITLALRFDLMGTREWYHTAYYNQSKKTIEFTDSDYTYMYDDTYFTLKQSIKGLDKDGKEVEFKKGDRLLPVSSDMDKFICYKTEDGIRVKMQIQKKDWRYFINGIFQDDLFENIGYAG